MKKNILIINSLNKENLALLDVFEELSNSWNLFLLSNKKWLRDEFKKRSWKKEKTYFGPKINSGFKFFLFLIILPFVAILNLIPLIKLHKNKRIKNLILLGLNEKIIFTLLLFFSKTNILWIETKHKKIYNNIFFNLLYKTLSKKVKIITLSSAGEKNLLKRGVKKEKINIIPLGIKTKKDALQKNIFSSLSHKDTKKYFTIGCVLNSNKTNQLENLFNTIKLCLDITKDIQVIIIGESTERKRIIWLAKKMMIENYFWFIGKQKNLKKWINTFNIFIPLDNSLNLNTLKTVKLAMLEALPVVGFHNQNLEDIIREEDLIKKNNPEKLSQIIINFYKNKLLINKIGKENFEKINSQNIKKIKEKWEDLLI